MALGEFVATVEVPDAALVRARVAVQDTVGVALAGVNESVSTTLQSQAQHETPIGPARIVGTTRETSAAWAALANGAAAYGDAVAVHMGREPSLQQTAGQTR